MEKKKINKKKLSWKKFLPLIIIIIIGIIGIVSGYAQRENIFDLLLSIFGYEYRTELIWFISIIIGIFHFYHTAKKKISKYAWINTSYPFLNSMFTISGIAIIFNSCMSISKGIVEEFIEKCSFFVHPENLDFVSLIGAIVVLYCFCFINVWNLIKETIFISTIDIE